MQAEAASKNENCNHMEFFIFLKVMIRTKPSMNINISPMFYTVIIENFPPHFIIFILIKVDRRSNFYIF